MANIQFEKINEKGATFSMTFTVCSTCIYFYKLITSNTDHTILSSECLTHTGKYSLITPATDLIGS